jgi:hypothetical protein
VAKIIFDSISLRQDNDIFIQTKQIKYYSIFIIKVPFQTDRIQNVTMEQITKWRGTTSIGYNG